MDLILFYQKCHSDPYRNTLESHYLYTPPSLSNVSDSVDANLSVGKDYLVFIR